ncbi:MAG: phosphate ABC transporter permease subunit PstC [Actinobacteria bacterium]|nr:phosphate ABC transporter permease subunit PstC [Actinomycetota bacterium]MBL7061089.1 phosphate ABC transporter permease subunit PstC [Actinomycetota bacterium]
MRNFRKKFRQFKKFLITKLVFLSGILSIIVLGLILAFLVYNSIKFFITYPFFEFLTGTKWSPTVLEKFGFVPLLTGSLLITFGAIIIAIPLGVGSAIYIGELAPRPVRETIKPIIEVLATIPSVVIGFIGIKVMAPIIKNVFNLNIGLTALTGSIMLAFMSLPTIISISEDAINAVPNKFRNASIALGATKWETTIKTVVPAASSGIFAATMLGLGRVVGETMTVLMITGNSPRIVFSWLQPVRTITATIAAEMGETAQGGLHFSALFAIGLILFIITFLINLIADRFINRIKNT